MLKINAIKYMPNLNVEITDVMKNIKKPGINGKKRWAEIFGILR